MSAQPEADSFAQLSLLEPVLRAVNEVGYETPSPIQAKTIPCILAGNDVLAQAQTGTGKTAAFALPLLSQIDLANRKPQVLVLTPTRELAIQVSEAFHKYASHLEGFHVLPIYGGQDYRSQLKNLKRGVHVVVGTPGRVMDHMRRGTLKLKHLSCLVLDEADEMLRMGFAEDVEWILEQTPEEHQVALFSATIPKEIRRIAQQHLKDPNEIYIEVKTTTAETINQRYLSLHERDKLDALTRVLEVEEFEGVIIFVRTRTATNELSDKLKARGFAASAINGDIDQKSRERTIEQLRKGKLDILVATDVAARGLDVERITHVINYDVPYDTESYVHRIGRTGRAGRNGEAILFVTPRERRMLRAIEKTTRQKIKLMDLPSAAMLSDKRVAAFKDKITETLVAGNLAFYLQVVEQYQEEHGISLSELAAALSKLAQGNRPLLVKDRPFKKVVDRGSISDRRDKGNNRRKTSKSRFSSALKEGMETYRIEVGKHHGAKAGNIVGAIANEAGIDAENIGKIKLFESHSTVDLPEGMPKPIFKTLKKVWVANQQLNISKLKEPGKQRSKRSR